MKHLLRHRILISLILLTIVVVGYRINRPLTYLHDWNGAHYGIFARNHLLMGYPRTQLAQVRVVDPEPTDTAHNLYVDFHHPVFYPILLSPFLAILGYTSELALRLPSLIACILSTIFLYRIAKHYWGEIGGVTAALLPLATPMVRYFGSLPAQDPLILAALLGQLHAYIQWTHNNQTQAYRYIWLWGILASLLGWPGYYLTAYILLHFVLVYRTITKQLLALTIIPVISFFTHALHNKIVTGDWLGGGLGTAFLFRLSWKQDEHGSFNYQEFIIRSVQWWQVYFTRILLLTSLLGSLTIIKPLLQNKLGHHHALILVLGLLGLTHPIIFRNAAFRHEYMWLYMIPFLSLATAAFINSLYTWIIKNYHRPHTRVYFVPLLILILFSLAWTERQRFVQTLFTNQLHRPGYELGLLIQRHTRPSDRVLVTNDEFISFFGRFAQFYGQREIDIGLPEKFPPDTHALIVIPTTHTMPPPEIMSELDNQYQRQQTDTFIWYDTTKASRNE